MGGGGVGGGGGGSVGGMGGDSGGKWWNLQDDGYIYMHLFTHLYKAHLGHRLISSNLFHLPLKLFSRVHATL